MGVIIRNELRHAVIDAEAFSGRIMTLTFRSSLPVTFISVYAPTALATKKEKEDFWEQLEEVYTRHASKGPTFVGGDLNARLSGADPAEVSCVGKFTYDKSDYGHVMHDPKKFSQELLIEHATKMRWILANTIFEKPYDKMVTWKFASYD